MVFFFFFRQEVVLEEPDESIRTKTSEIYSSKNKYVELQMTDKTRDLGQNVVPYFDAQDVTLSPALPLQGVGLFHKGTKYFGGFIGFKIIHYNLADEKDVPFEQPEDIVSNYIEIKPFDYDEYIKSKSDNDFDFQGEDVPIGGKKFGNNRNRKNMIRQQRPSEDVPDNQGNSKQDSALVINV